MKKYDFIYEVSYGGKSRIITRQPVKTGPSIKLDQKSEKDPTVSIYYATEKGLKDLQKQFPNNAYGDKYTLGTADLTSIGDGSKKKPTTKKLPKAVKLGQSINKGDRFKTVNGETWEIVKTEIDNGEKWVFVKRSSTNETTESTERSFRTFLRNWDAEPITTKPKDTTQQRRAGAKGFMATRRKMAERGDFKNYSPIEVLFEAQKFHSARTKSGAARDEKTDGKKRLTPTPENLVRWMKDPGKFDLIGVDTFEKNNPTADLKIKKEIFWHRLLKK